MPLRIRFLLMSIFMSTDASQRSPTVSRQFKTQLATLMDTLNSTNPSFVRCIKPNALKLPLQFDAGLVLDQLRYSGLLEVCRIRQLGFPIRKEFSYFLFRYTLLGAKNAIFMNEFRGESEWEKCQILCACLCDTGVLTRGEYVLGHTKIFLRQPMHESLEKCRNEQVVGQVIVLQKFLRRVLAMAKMKTYYTVLNNLESLLGDSVTADELELGLESCSILPSGGSHLDIVRHAHRQLVWML